MSSEKNYVSFFLDKQGYALPIACVESVLRAVEITLLPKAQEFVCGVINVHGEVIPVVNMRKLFEREQRTLRKEDIFIVCKFASQSFTLWVDEIGEILEHISAQSTMQDSQTTENLETIKHGDQVLLIPDLEHILLKGSDKP